LDDPAVLDDPIDLDDPTDSDHPTEGVISGLDDQIRLVWHQKG